MPPNTTGSLLHSPLIGLFDPKRVFEQPEGLGGMGLQRERPPDTVDICTAHSAGRRGLARWQCRCLFLERLLRRRFRHPRHPWPGFVKQTGEAFFHEALPPFAHGLNGKVKLRSRLGVGKAVCTEQNQARPQGQSLWTFGLPGPGTQCLAFTFCQQNRSGGASGSHLCRLLSAVMAVVKRGP
jgi:hypothetical protein